jgi:hypothetical protein
VWERSACIVVVEKLKERVHFEDLGLDGRIALKWTLRIGGYGLDSLGSR